jgi:hypothetical protein
VALLWTAASVLVFTRVGIAQVNDPPSIQLPASPSLTEDVPAVISGITVSDPEDGALSVSLVADFGSVVPDQVVGTPAQINTALAGLEYTPAEDYSGPVTIDIGVADGPHFVFDQLALTIDPAAPQSEIRRLARRWARILTSRLDQLHELGAIGEANATN